jgi:hypothetical protein
MTGVYSGGLVYEYSQEPSNYGLVDLSSGTPEELPDFQTLADQYSKTPNPQGDGGYSSEQAVSDCPAYSDPNWLVKGSSLPSIPDGAVKYMTASDGAGAGPGLSGPGSQNAGGESTGTATAGSGAATRTGDSGSSTNTSNAASALIAPQWSLAPLVCGAITVFSMICGASLL